MIGMEQKKTHGTFLFDSWSCLLKLNAWKMWRQQRVLSFCVWQSVSVTSWKRLQSVAKDYQIHREPVIFCSSLAKRKCAETTTLKCRKPLSVLEAVAAKVLNNARSSCCIGAWCSLVSMTVDQASKQHHWQICWCWTECRTRQWESYHYH